MTAPPPINSSLNEQPENWAIESTKKEVPRLLDVVFDSMRRNGQIEDNENTEFEAGSMLTRSLSRISAFDRKELGNHDCRVELLAAVACLDRNAKIRSSVERKKFYPDSQAVADYTSALTPEFTDGLLVIQQLALHAEQKAEVTATQSRDAIKTYIEKHNGFTQQGHERGS